MSIKKSGGLCENCKWCVSWQEARPYGSTVAYETMSDCKLPSTGLSKLKEDKIEWQDLGSDIKHLCLFWQEKTIDI